MSEKKILCMEMESPCVKCGSTQAEVALEDILEGKK